MERAHRAPAIVWLRNDLRLADNPALTGAVASGAPVLPVFIWAPEEEGEWAPGAASRWWLHQSLARLQKAFEQLGSPLVLRRGDSLGELSQLARQSGAQAVFWNRRHEPAIAERDRRIEQELRALGCQVQVHAASLLTDPQAVRNQGGKPFQVFTAFWKSCLASLKPLEPLVAPGSLIPPTRRVPGIKLETLDLEPRIHWASGLAATWDPGEAGAARRLGSFCQTGIREYRLNRDHPAVEGTSRLSPHLHFGEITPKQIWHDLARTAWNSRDENESWKSSQFVTELGWREFAHHLLCQYPHTPTRPLRPAFQQFPWRNDPATLKAWQCGRTGYPLVDAGMRELWATGWMHNRVRMIVASFLVKDLLIPWQEGARWFWDTLVDADLAHNTLGWQWTAGCGADAAPFFRVFNPIAQGEKFDPEGAYVRRWVPELARLPARWIHRPWQAPAALLRETKADLGRTYPPPIVDHTVARQKALAAFDKLRSKSLARRI